VAARLASEKETILSLNDSINQIHDEMEDLRTAIETATESLPEKTKAVTDLEAVIEKHNSHIPKEIRLILEKMKQGVEKAKNQVDNIRDWEGEIIELGIALHIHNDNKRRAEANVAVLKKDVKSAEENFARSKQMRRAAILLRHVNELGVRGVNDLGMEKMRDLCKLLDVEVDDEEDENTPNM
jgi:chromosome segregation ATPase